MPDLFQIIAAYEARQPARTTTLTIRGQAVVAARELGRLIASVDDPLDRLRLMQAALDEALTCLELDAPRTA